MMCCRCCDHLAAVIVSCSLHQSSCEWCDCRCLYMSVLFVVILFYVFVCEYSHLLCTSN